MKIPFDIASTHAAMLRSVLFCLRALAAILLILSVRIGSITP